MQLLGGCPEKVWRDDCCIIRYGSRVKGELKSFIESSNVDVTKLNPDEVVNAIKKRYPDNVTVYLSELSFDYLKTIIRVPIGNDLLDPTAIRVENLERMARSVMEEKDSFFDPVDGLDRIDSLLSKQQDPPIQRVIESGVLPKVVELLQRDDEYEIQLVASDILLNVASGGSPTTEEVVKVGALPPLVHLLSSSHTGVAESAAWALGNNAVVCPNRRDLVLQAGAMQPLLNLIDDHQTSVKSVRRYVWLLSNLCRGSPKPDFNIVSLSLPVLKRLLYHNDGEVLIDTCWALSYLCEDTYAPSTQVLTNAFSNSDVCRLVELAEHPNKDVQLAALRVMGNFVAGNESQTQLIIDNGALPCLLSLLSGTSTKEIIRQERCWLISNIAAGTEDQIQAMIDSGILCIVASLMSHVDSVISWEALGVLTRATAYGGSKQIKYLIEQGCINSMLELLRREDNDAETIRLVLEALDNVSQVSTEDTDGESHIKSILDAIDSRRMIEELQLHDNGKFVFPLPNSALFSC